MKKLVLLAALGLSFTATYAKIATVNIDQAVAQCSKQQTIQKDAQKRAQDFEQYRQKCITDLQQESQAVAAQAEAGVLSPAAQQEKMLEVRQHQQEMELALKARREKIELAVRLQQDELRQEAGKAARKVQEQENFEALFDSNLLLAGNAVDVTSQVIDVLNSSGVSAAEAAQVEA